MASWVPWPLLLPTSATELLNDEAERLRLREALTRVAKDYSRLLLLWAVRAAQVFAGISFLFATASLLYALLYYAVIPSRFHEQEIFFHYGQRHVGIVSQQESNAIAVPTASLDLRDPVHQWQSLVPKPEQSTQPVLVPGVKYDVIVELTVSESRVNAEVGVFMVSTSLWEGTKRQLAASARPVTLHDVPAPVRWLKLAFWLMPYALGFTEPAQALRVTAINGYLESAEYPLTRVDIALNTPKLQVYSAKLTVIAQLTGLRYLMYHWAVPTAILFILNIVFLEALALVILYAVYALPQLDEEAAADAAVLEAVAADARDKAKKLFETDSTPETEVKSETLIGEVSFTAASMEEASSVFEEAPEEDDAVKEEEVKKEAMADSP
ncbi:Berardinelli-Seip congenital lipodystrophy 2 (seipin) [Phytophthora pseudosyringae]|uniref:Berardinelli-Seip congenital lipodystrophy 2 (Seipin) n=1 Tax=Phytophthora pseudosyringae TaxID=221518 RepID=A0A8T1VP89_9STRA|nr:Berardinelli-Seip congenital lipodystrophy 2 (seipin) [Phytophthora pseudosyringae]